MSIDRATIINWALTDIGIGPVFSVDDGSDLSQQIENTWQRCVDHIFGLTDWSFAQKTFRNTRLAGTPENGFTYAFELPGNRIGNPLKIWDDPRARRPVRDFAIEAGLLYCDRADTWSRCKVAVDPDVWPPEFRSAFVVALAGYLAVPVYLDDDLRDRKLSEAFGTPSREMTGGLFGRLMAQDKASQPVGEPMAQEDPVTMARHGGAGDHWAGRFA